MSLDLSLDSSATLDRLTASNQMRSSTETVGSLLRYAAQLGKYVRVERVVLSGLILEQDATDRIDEDSVDFL